jgi:CBS domain-containing protein
MSLAGGRVTGPSAGPVLSFIFPTPKSYQMRMTPARPKPVQLADFINPHSTVFSIASREVSSVRQMDAIEGCLSIMLGEGRRRLPVTDSSGRLKGMVSETDILGALGAGPGRKAVFGRPGVRVRDIMVSSPRWVPKSHTVKRALQDLRFHGVGILPILDSGRPEAMVSEWDFAVRIPRKTGLRAGDVMTARPVMAREWQPIREVARMMAMGPFRRLPVMDERMLVGIATPHDVLAYLHRKGRLGELPDEDAPISDAMNRHVAFVRPDEDVGAAAFQMRHREIGGLPVVDGFDVLGIITKRDLMDVLA